MPCPNSCHLASVNQGDTSSSHHFAKPVLVHQFENSVHLLDRPSLIPLPNANHFSLVNQGLTSSVYQSSIAFFQSANLDVNPSKGNLRLNVSAESIFVGDNATVIVSGLKNAQGNVSVFVTSPFFPNVS